MQTRMKMIAALRKQVPCKLMFLQILAVILIFVSLDVTNALVSSSTTTKSSSSSSLSPHQPSLSLAGDWAKAKADLRNPDCCVVSVAGLESHLKVLQDLWALEPADVDLRARVRVRSTDYGSDHTYDDCLQIRCAVTPMEDKNDKINNDIHGKQERIIDPYTTALQELACGVASLADGPFEEICDGVFLRVVCASNYKARDPMFHTDKAPLRGYVTLRGPGTDFVTRTCTPLEYLSLRSLGTLLPGGQGTTASSLRRANELEFIVMKGDHYSYEEKTSAASTMISSSSTTTTMMPSLSNEQSPPIALKDSSWMKKIWKRTFACVHRSPPADDTTTTGGLRRVIVSLDLADGDDDREWYQINKKREWRNGMTQRKSHLVA